MVSSIIFYPVRLQWPVMCVEDQQTESELIKYKVNGTNNN